MADKNLRWSERALEENRQLFDYLLNEWGVEIALRVREQIDSTAKRIQDAPEHFQIFIKTRNIRRCVISPQTSLFFRVSKKEVEIMSVFDNRQSPKKRKL
ncbi:MAG: type II toxin-antitoxin system RelE/ParE family toxin [Mucilaginibacter sp.]